MSQKSFIIIIIAIALLAAVNIYVYLAKQPAIATQAQKTQVKSSGEALIGGAFTLTSHKGKTTTDKDFHGKLLLVYFGFSNCPAICPTDLNNLSHVLNELGSDTEKIEAIFITVDPERDTVERLVEYMESFHENIIALTGSREQIDTAMQTYRVFASKVENEGMEGYMMDHSTFTYLMGKDGKYLTHFSHNTDAKEIVAKIREYF